MAVVSATTIQIKPDKYEAFLGTSRDAKKILERCGAKNVRVMGSLAAGAATGSFITSWEADDYAAYGVVMDKFLADSEGLALLMASNAAEGPTAGFQGSVWTDIPL